MTGMTLIVTAANNNCTCVPASVMKAAIPTWMGRIKGLLVTNKGHIKEFQLPRKENNPLVINAGCDKGSTIDHKNRK